MRTLTLLIALLIGSSPAAAEVIIPEPPTKQPTDADKKAAEAAYASAQQAYGEGELLEALGHADAAFAAVPNASTALVRAIILADMKRPRQAFRVYLDAINLDPTPDEKAMITDGLASQGTAAGLGWLAVRPSPGTAWVYVGDKAFKGSRTIGLDAGSYELRVEAPEFQSATSSVAIVAGAGRAVNATLSPTQTHIVTPPKTDPKRGSGDGGGPNTLALGLTIGGAVVAATATGLYFWAVSANDTAIEEAVKPAEEGPVQEALRRQRFNDAIDKRNQRLYAAYTLWALGGAAFATGIVLFVVDSDGDEGQGAGGVSVTPALSADGAGVVLGGTF